jgi:hypothetical protein
LNRNPTFAVKNKTLKESWSEQRLVVNHLIIFRRISYAHIPNQNKKNLDDKGYKWIFLVLVII